MRIERIGAVVAVCLTFALSGCAGYTRSINKGEPVQPEAAYLYGSFTINTPPFWLGLDSYATMGFAIACKSARESTTYTIRFSKDDPLQVIKIAPGQCTLREFVYTDGDGIVKARKPAPGGLMKDAVFEKGKAYYLGDYKAHATLGSANWFWDIDRAWDNYSTTTEELKLNFPNLAVLESENRMIGKY
ncbi:MAG TPA: hypothetical protein VK539_27000 [Myxococcaceae bacterium]|nr:hypothetical protein [Myxococcaceae bacterium]